MEDIDYVTFNLSKNNWIKFDGTFNEGLRHGLGILYLINDDVFSCEWKNGALNGDGKIKQARGKVIYGIWGNNKKIEDPTDIIKQIQTLENLVCPQPTNKPENFMNKKLVMEG